MTGGIWRDEEGSPSPGHPTSIVWFGLDPGPPQYAYPRAQQQGYGQPSPGIAPQGQYFAPPPVPLNQPFNFGNRPPIQFAYPPQNPVQYPPPHPGAYPRQAPTLQYQPPGAFAAPRPQANPPRQFPAYQPPGTYIAPAQNAAQPQFQAPGYYVAQPQSETSESESKNDQNRQPSITQPSARTIAFGQADIRAGFVRKVFGLVALMLIIVVGLVCLFIFQKDCNRFVKENPWVYFMSFGVFLVSYIGIMCCESCRRTYPTNILCLLLLTLSMGYMTAMICCFHDLITVLIAAVSCAVGCGAIALLSFHTKYDFTTCMGALFGISIVLFLFGIIAIICAMVFHIYWVYIVYAGGACLLCMVYLAVDIQLIVGGKRIELSPEEYVLGATQLFVDIILIFIYFVQIIGYFRSDN